MNTIPATPPSSNLGRRLALVGTVLQVSPLIGLAFTLRGMMLAFDQVDTSTVADPSTVSFAIGEVLIATLIGLVISILGAILILLAIYTTDYRAPWLLTALFVIGLLLTLAFPIGTLFGIALLVTAAVKRHEFLNTKQQPPP